MSSSFLFTGAASPNATISGGGVDPSVSSCDTHCCLLHSTGGWFVQIALGVTALSSLMYKRHAERPIRACRVWLADVSKQCLSAVMAHFLNILLAAIYAGTAGPGVDENDECAWYVLY